MTSLKPYLIRALHEWILENGLTPYLLVDANYEGVSVPTAYVSDDRIILNTHPDAIHDWHLDNEAVSFSARFSGRTENLYVPVNAVSAVYAKENGKGMMFDEHIGGDTQPDPENPKPAVKTRKPVLTVVK